MKHLTFLLLIFLFLSCSKEKKADKAGEKMQVFVIEISDYARGLDPDFIVIPQNGIELAFDYLDPADGTHPAYMAAVDGFGVEELFYDGDLSPDNERLSMLQELPESKKVMVAEFVSDNSNINDAINRNIEEGFICFPRTNNNYDYLEILDTVVDENSNDITSLQEAQNYLYLISTDNFSSKADMITAISATNFDVILIDLFFEEVELTFNEVQQLKTKANGGKRLAIAYMNIGSAENYRYYWQEDWKLHRPNWLKKAYEGYDDEIWVKFWNEDWRDIIYGNDNSYTKKIVDAGFDGTYLDNVEAYYFLYFD
ncbi:MAG: endo alpha-1,4 polygalactosaminidase [Bacteroidetes bacterium]|nr:endo alpha-1,4 polygalactosaminidase [Bacteroidota bacterium]